jgi:GNAT superfamily N-acetyltransferase
MRIEPGFREEHVLADGTRVTLRLIRTDDGEGLRQAFARLSPMSRYRRFLLDTSELTDEMVRYLCDVDGYNHFALVVTTDSFDLKTEIGLGVGRFCRLAEEPDVAEAALTVVDDAQGKGIGRLLLHTVAEAARERGIRTIRAEVLASNTPIRRLLDQLGAVVRSDDGTTLVFDVPLDGPPECGKEGERAALLSSEQRRDPRLRMLLRTVAESFAALRSGARES